MVQCTGFFYGYNRTPMFKHLTIVLCLFSLLLGVYLITYRGIPLSGDELALFSSTESLVRYGNPRLYSAYYHYPGGGDNPFSQPVHEPMQILLSIPLYWTAFHLEGIGILDTVWLFNLLVTAMIGVLIYLTGTTLGYSTNTSVATALLVCLGTMLWPYTQTYFREPLAALWVTLAFYLAFRLQQQWRWWVAGLLLIVCAAALLTKEILFLMFPALLVVLWPQPMSRRKFLLWGALVAVGLVVMLGVVAVASETGFGNDRFNSSAYTRRAEASSLDYFLTVVGAYLLSPGRSLWATSPILLVSLYGGWLAYRQHKGRLAFAPFVLLVTVTAGYAVGGWDWHGGLGWGTRYLLHVVPIVGLLLLPVLQQLPALNRLWWLLGAVLLAFSVAVQIGGVMLPTGFAYNFLSIEFPEKGALAFQEEATWQPRYTQWYLHLRHLDWENPAIAWQDTRIGLIAGVIFILLGVVFFVWNTRRDSPSPLGFILFPIWIVGIGVSLHAIQDDSRFSAHRPELQALRVSVEQQAGQDDLVLLANPEYLYFFLNSYRGQAVVVTLPYLAGERYSPTQPDPPVEDADGDGLITPNERLDTATSRLMRYLHHRYQNVWLVMNSGPFLPWAYRPAESSLTQMYFPVSEANWSADVRLIRIYPYYNLTYPEITTRHTPYQFGEHLVLTGYDVPLKIEAGAVLPVTLLWNKTGQVDFNYNVGVLLTDETGAVRAQHDGAPQGGFGDTLRWRIGEPNQDTHGIAIPTDLPPGVYQLQVVLYDWRDSTRLPVTYEGQLMEGSTAEIATVEVGAYTSPQLNEISDPAPLLEQPYQFGENFQLIGAEFPEEATVGSTITITTTWDVEQGGNFNPTLLLKKGSIVTAVNHLAVSLYNEQFHEGVQTYRHEMYIPENFPSGKYTLRVMVYDWANASTLNPTPSEYGYFVVLGTVEINSP